MAVSFVTTSPAVGTTYTLGNYDDDLMVGPNVVLAGSSVFPAGIIRGTDSLHTVTLAGTILTDFLGVQLGNHAVDDYNSTLTVTQSGQIISQYEGVYLWNAGSNVTNAGLILGEINAINIHSSTGSSINITNSGRIEGGNGIISSGLFGLPTLSLHNTGTIYTVSGIAIASTGITTVTNHGEIFGEVSFGLNNDSLVNRGTIEGLIGLGAGNDSVDNRGGVIEGDLTLGDGNDVLDNRGGVIIGAITGGLGNEIFKPGAGIEIIDGGSGSDALDFRGTPAVVVSLDDSLPNAGFAAGDEYLGIDLLYGSYFGDVLVGSALANTIRGYGGADTIDGGAGVDKIIGGNGVDVLTGGAGSDVFIFDRLAEAGDVITDFSSVVGNSDLFNIKGTGFGGGLVLGTLADAAFQSRADNVAQDATDRFIFNTTDATLWFDADGNGTGAAVMVADLQAGAVVDRFDIVII